METGYLLHVVDESSLWPYFKNLQVSTVNDEVCYRWSVLPTVIAPNTSNSIYFLSSLPFFSILIIMLHPRLHDISLCEFTARLYIFFIKIRRCFTHLFCRLVVRGYSVKTRSRRIQARVGSNSIRTNINVILALLRRNFPLPNRIFLCCYSASDPCHSRRWCDVKTKII